MGLVGRPDLGEQDSLKVSVSEEIDGLLSRELRSPGFGIFMISYHVTTARSEVLESILSGVRGHGRS